jgi:hypothetical protein
MENRERDRVSQRTTPTDAGQINRHVEEEKGREVNSGTSAEFGQSIGRSENLSEGGEMRNRNQDDMSSKNMNRDMDNDMSNESGRNSGSGSMGSSSGRNSGSRNEDSSNISGNKSSNRSSTGELGSTGTGSSEGRH